MNTPDPKSDEERETERFLAGLFKPHDEPTDEEPEPERPTKFDADTFMSRLRRS